MTDYKRDSDDLNINAQKDNGGFNKKSKIIFVFLGVAVIGVFALTVVSAINNLFASSKPKAENKNGNLAVTMKNDNNQNVIDSMKQKMQKKITSIEDNKNAEQMEKMKELIVAQHNELLQLKAAYNQQKNKNIQSSKELDKNKPLTKDQREMKGGMTISLNDVSQTSAQSSQSSNGLTLNKGASSSDNYQSYHRANGAVSAVSQSDMSYLIQKGTFINATLQTRISTDYQGEVVAMVNRPVYSANGKTVLINAGSKLIGQQKIAMKGGVGRVYTVWNQVMDHNVTANLDSLGTGPMGAVGFEASEIDNHYGEKFGAAVLLSLFSDTIDTASQYYANKSSSDNSVSVNNSTATSKSIAEQALSNSIGIKPTAWVNPGTTFNILVVRNINFKPVFALKNLPRN